MEEKATLVHMKNLSAPVSDPHRKGLFHVLLPHFSSVGLT